ncbi:hypothetical protein [Actinomadura atramentaria]|uniref:hypothetical protein n=1 Tax=Actinomadura atramentaria TaxID=1990 RepID=UPI00037C1D37|nr:hypothetical protein [Actinomadura atramentaria]
MHKEHLKELLPHLLKMSPEELGHTFLEPGWAMDNHDEPPAPDVPLEDEKEKKRLLWNWGATVANMIHYANSVGISDAELKQALDEALRGHRDQLAFSVAGGHVEPETTVNLWEAWRGSKWVA